MPACRCVTAMPNLLVEAAIEYAQKAHEGQLRDDGRPYFAAHLAQVGNIISTITDDPIVIAAAYLHDTLEDTKTTLDDLIANFGPQVAAIVYMVTHEGSNGGYRPTGYYFPRLNGRATLVKYAILVKFADRLSNLSQMETWSEDRQDHYLRRSKFWKTSPNDPITGGQKWDIK